MSETKDLWQAYSDGASRGNPGPAAFGVVICDAQGKVHRQWGEVIGRDTNQAAEYLGFLAALEFLRRIGVRRAKVKTDSEFVVKQFNGLYKAKHPRMKIFLEKARAMAQGFDFLEVTHILRSSHPHNVSADRLANAALDQESRQSI